MAKGLWTVINVDNVDKSIEWYRALGLKVTVETTDMEGAEGMTYGTINSGVDSGVMLWNKHNVPSDQAEDTKAWVSGDVGKGVVLSFGVANAQKAWAGAQKIRAEVDVPMETQPWGGHGFQVVDPDGYVVQITDKFPGETPPKKRATKTTTRRATKTVKGKAKPKRKGR